MNINSIAWECCRSYLPSNIYLSFFWSTMLHLNCVRWTTIEIVTITTVLKVLVCCSVPSGPTLPVSSIPRILAGDCFSVKRTLQATLEGRSPALLSCLGIAVHSHSPITYDYLKSHIKLPYCLKPDISYAEINMKP